MSKSLEMIFSVSGIFPANVGPTEVKNLLHSLAISCGFCIMVLSTLISRGGRFHFVFYLPAISCITCHVRLESVITPCWSFSFVNRIKKNIRKWSETSDLVIPFFRELLKMPAVKILSIRLAEYSAIRVGRFMIGMASFSKMLS